MAGKTQPTPEQLAAGVPPLIIAYVNARIAAATKKQAAEIEGLKTQVQALRKQLAEALGNMEAKVKDVADLQARHDKYTLTKPKIIRLMKKQGIE